jgi:hypothetical protein
MADDLPLSLPHSLRFVEGEDFRRDLSYSAHSAGLAFVSLLDLRGASKERIQLLSCLDGRESILTFC